MKKLILVNVLGILIVIGIASVYNLGARDRYAETFKHYEGKIVGFPKDGDQLQEMFNRLDHPQVLYLAPRIYYIKSSSLKFDTVYDERNCYSFIGSPDGKSSLILKEDAKKDE